MKTTYFDTETSGLTIFDQILTFYALTLDENGKIIDQLNEKCSLDSFRLPSPAALLTNGLSPDKLKENQSSRDLLFKVHEYFSKHSPGLNIAHNAGFDFRMVHNGYYQNLITDNLYQLKTLGNNLLCSISLAKAAFAFSKDNQFKVKKDSLDNPRFDLSSLCEINNISFLAHDAQSDTQALFKLVSLIKREVPEIYNTAVSCSSKAKSIEIIHNQVFSLAALGSSSNYGIRAFCPIAIDKKGGSALCVDLSSDKLDELKSYSLMEIFSSMGEDIAKNQIFFRLPLNKSICLFDHSFLDFYDEGKKIGTHNLFKKASALRQNKTLKKLAEQVLIKNNSRFITSNPEAEELIYQDGFPNPIEKSFIRKFNSFNPNKINNLINDYRNRLSSDRFIRLANRTLNQFFPNTVSPIDHEKFFRWSSKRLFSYPNDDHTPRWNTIFSCLEDLEKLKVKNPSKIKRLNQLESFYRREAYLNGVDLKHSLRKIKKNVQA
tara:strand:+ start:1905 stop:3374 length:1470 start_codon:yes stop_codon:yes gene_type:complete